MAKAILNMRFRARYFLALSAMLLVLLELFVECNHKSDSITPIENVAFSAPAHFPATTYDFAQNPVTSAGFTLGKMLFYDPILSKDRTVSCGFCHLQASGFTQHGHRLSHGINNQFTQHNSMPIQNLAWGKSFFWDGGVDQLDLFAPNPINSPVEMGSSLGLVLSRLRAKPGYRDLFAKAFGDTAITTSRFLKALSQFQLMCISADSKYDRVLLGKPGYAFSPAELAGKQLFEAKCARCHSGVLFTDGLYHSNGLDMNNSPDSGRAHVTGFAANRYHFKTPSLRNVTFTYPYMHDGRFATLTDVLNHYATSVVNEPYVDPDLRASKGIALTADDKANLIAFLNTLSDTSFVSNALLATPTTLP